MEERSPTWSSSTAEFQSECRVAAAASTTLPYSRLNYATEDASRSNAVSRPVRRDNCSRSRKATTMPPRRTSLLGSTNPRSILLAALCVLLWCSPCIAAAIAFGDDMSSAASGYSEILFDRSDPPLPHVRLVKRANSAGSTTTTSTSTSTTEAASLPSPFDSSLGNNFTVSSCPSFFQSFLSDDTLNDCLPLSLLLQTSTSFFTVEQSPVRLAQTLDATCNVDFTTCSTYMAGLARQLQLSSACGDDLAAENPTVLQAYHGLASYDAMYHAGCLKDNSTGSYCFSDAVTNSSSPTSSYIYYLPLGVSLPSNTAPTCNSCLQNTMSVFAGAAANSSQPVAKTYPDAAKLIDGICGDDFVGATAAAAATGTTGASKSGSGSTSRAGRVRGDGVGFVGLGVLVALVGAVVL